MAAPELKAASTVVVMRPSGSGFEVLLVKRHDNVAFMGGAHVFPGGRVDASDRFEDPERVCDGVAEAVARLPDQEPVGAVAHYVAAVRELLEEAGLLLARPVAPSSLVRLRSEVAAGAGLAGLAARDGFRLTLDRLVPFAHWITPEIETKRFDTRFFVAMLPAGQAPLHDDRETVHSEWLPPREAVERCRRDEIALPPPTWTTLRMLSKLDTADDIMRWARQRKLRPLQPGFIRNGAEIVLTLPGDPTFPVVEGFEALDETRFILEGGRWRAAR